MITKNEIAKIAKQILKRQRGLRDHQIIHPTREWFVGLAFSLVIFISGATWSIFTYLEVSGRTVETTPTEVVTANVYRSDIVSAALAKFRERTDNFNQLLENRVIVTSEESGEIPAEIEPAIPNDERSIENASSTESSTTPEPEDVSIETSGEVEPVEIITSPDPIADGTPINFN